MIRKIINESENNLKPHIITKDELKELNDYLKRNGRTEYIDTYRDNNSIYTDISWGDWKHDHIWIQHLVREFFINRDVYVKHESFTTEEDGSDTYSAEHIWTLYDLPRTSFSESASDVGQVKILDDMLSDLISNVPDDILNHNIDLFNKIAKDLKIKDFNKIYVFIHDGTYDLGDYTDKFELVKTYDKLLKDFEDVRLFKFNNILLVQEFVDNGRYFIYAKSENDLDALVDVIDNYYNETNDSNVDQLEESAGSDNKTKYDDAEDIADFLDTLIKTNRDKLKELMSKYGVKNNYNLARKISDEDLDELGYKPPKLDPEEYKDWFDKYVKDNDKYFPRVDIKNDRYDYYKYDNKDFAYDRDNSTVIYLFRDANEVSELGDEAPYRELDAIDFSEDDWKNKDERDWHLSKYIDNLNAEVNNLMNDFIKYELPESHKKESVSESKTDFSSLKDTHTKYQAQLNVDASIYDYSGERDNITNDDIKDGVELAIADLSKEIKKRIDKKLNKDNTYVDLSDNDVDTYDFTESVIYSYIYIDSSVNSDIAINAIKEITNLDAYGETTFTDFDYDKGSVVRASDYIPATYAGWTEYPTIKSDMSIQIIITSVEDIKRAED